MGHTKGPWVAGGTTVWGSNEGSCRNTVCSTVCCGSLTKEEDASNARLIAAAPEMKEALELALEVIDERDIPVGDGGTSYNNIGVIIRTALAKAEGN